MSITATSSEVQKNFGAYLDQALVEPVRVTKYDREAVFIVSAKTFHAMKQAQRRSLSVGSLTEQELADIARAEIPASKRYTSK
jgi:antitoxin StbD